MKVTTFVGERETITKLYSELKNKMGVDIYCKPNICELKVEPVDYVHALAMGSNVIRKENLSHIAWISPCGTPIARFNELASETPKKLESMIMTAFTSQSSTEIYKLVNRLSDVEISAMATSDDRGTWSVLVRPEDYLEAVAIGAKFVDGNGLNQVLWNDPTGDYRFSISQVAKHARTELDEALEA